MAESTPWADCLSGLLPSYVYSLVERTAYVEAYDRTFGYNPDWNSYISETPYTVNNIRLDILSLNTAKRPLSIPFAINGVTRGLIICGCIWTFNSPEPLNLMTRNEFIYRSLEHAAKSKHGSHMLVSMLVHEAQHLYLIELFRKSGYDSQSWSLEDEI